MDRIAIISALDSLNYPLWRERGKKKKKEKCPKPELQLGRNTVPEPLRAGQRGQRGGHWEKAIQP